jgi:uncharacterized membrane protein
MTEQEKNVTLTEKEYKEILDQLEDLTKASSMSLKSTKDSEYAMMLFSKPFWDNFFTKFIANFVSVKMWILFTVLYWPYELVKEKSISGENYTNIIIVVAPLVVGLREYAKSIAIKKSNDKSSTTSSSSGDDNQSAASRLLTLVRQKFHI